MASVYDLPMEAAPEVAPTSPVGAPRHLRAVPATPLDFDDVVSRLRPRLQRYATRRLGDAHGAEEVVQEALLRAYSNRAQLLTEEDVAAWTTCVAGRLVIDRLRVSNRSTSYADVPEGKRMGRDTADVVVARDEARTALDALDAMPSRQAAILWAREIEGLPYEEIGLRYGMTEPAVRSILTRARKALRKEYALRGGTLPVGGLGALAPWLDGFHWLDRFRRAVGRTLTPAALGISVIGSAIVGGAFVSPSDGAKPPVRAPYVTNAASPVHFVPAKESTALAGAAPAAAAERADVAARPKQLDQSYLSNVCAQRDGVGAGSRRCAPPAPDEEALYLEPRLPDNPTGITSVGVGTDVVRCRELPDTVLTECRTQGASR
ncbi:MAG TPA: RNA polymerase sigma factor [Mycobacteriales bacterium]|nr:RNA polymerase sigma factor [Mycobacteriales bacterium]